MRKFQKVKSSDQWKRYKNNNDWCLGDKYMVEKLEYYLEKRKRLLNYKGKSAVKKTVVDMYEKKLLDDDPKKWWNNYNKSYIKNVLWFLRRLKKGQSKKEEYELLQKFVQRLPYYKKFFIKYSKNDLNNDKELYNRFKEVI